MNLGGPTLQRTVEALDRRDSFLQSLVGVMALSARLDTLLAAEFANQETFPNVRARVTPLDEVVFAVLGAVALHRSVGDQLAIAAPVLPRAAESSEVPELRSLFR